jgi:ankyrin repeat protein
MSFLREVWEYLLSQPGLDKMSLDLRINASSIFDLSQIEISQSVTEKLGMDLFFAVYGGNAEECQRLVVAGVDVNSPPPFLAAANCGIARSQGIDTDSIVNSMPLHSAASYGHAEVCRILIEAGAAIDARNALQSTPLHLAAIEGKDQVCRLLMEAGASANARNEQQFTPLHFAALHGHNQACRVLTEAGAACRVLTQTQNTPLHLAAFNGHAEACRILIDARSDVNANEANQYTPLHLAAINGHSQACRVLTEAGAAINNAQNVETRTPLHLAASTGHVDVCRLLMEAGAAIDARDGQQVTPLFDAALCGHNSTCMLLTFKGADRTALCSAGTTAGHLLHLTPDEAADMQGHTALAAHLRSSYTVCCLRCTGPSLEPRLFWNDTTPQQEETVLDEMQAQWLARVAEGCAHARVGLTLRGAFSGGLSTDLLLHVMDYVFGGTQAHLQSCISTGRVVARAGGLATQTVVAVAAAVLDGRVTVAATAAAMVLAGAVPALERAMVVSGTSKGGPMQERAQRDQQQLTPKLALVSHALALAATPTPPVSSSSAGVLGAGARQQLQAELARLVVVTDTAEGGCEWLHAYCAFLRRRHRLGL